MGLGTFVFACRVVVAIGLYTGFYGVLVLPLLFLGALFCTFIQEKK